MLEQDPAMPAHRREAIKVIRRGGDHLLSLIDGTLDIARIESGRFRLDPRPISLPNCLAQIVQLFELQAADKGLTFIHQFSPLPDTVRCDEKRLRQILINLLGNAVKFTRVGQVVFRVDYLRDMAHFEIEDTGPGIAPSDMPAIFEPFSRGADAGSGGTGLGLTISKMLTDLMGGEMTASSILGVGTQFRIRLFLPATPESTMVSPVDVAASSSPRPGSVAWVWPAPELLSALQRFVDLGYLRGIVSQLEIIERADPGHLPLVARLRSLAQRFEFDAINALLKEAPHV
jgi:signal transduction histidine kinase